MTPEQFKIFCEWTERVANTANNTDTNISASDILHDIAGILVNDEHFLPKMSVSGIIWKSK